jgi:hypothetical protein
MSYPTDFQSKFAHLIVALELQRNSSAAGRMFTSVAACPDVIISSAVPSLS